MFGSSFTDAPLIGGSKPVGLDNYTRLDSSPRFRTAAWNTACIVLLTVLPGTVVALLIALGVSRLKDRMQAGILALACLRFQRNVTEAITLSAGIKG